MAVRFETFQFIIISLGLSLLTPVILTIYYKLRYKTFSFRPLLIGIAVWIVATQILEKLLHLAVLKLTPISHYPILLGIYGGLAAGIFEEIGRVYAYKRFLKNHHKRIDGISYGIGHGGIESILVGIMGSLQTLFLAIAINTNKLSSFAKGMTLPQLQAAVKTIVVSQPYIFLLSGLERVFALFIQIALSLIVLYSVRTKKLRYLILAILLHATMDFPAVLVQTKTINLWVAERIYLLLCILSISFIYKSTKLFLKDATSTSNTSSN